MPLDLSRYGINALWVIGFILIYFLIWRPIRGQMAYRISYPIAQSLSEDDHWIATPSNSVAFYISSGERDANEKSYSLKVLGGMFFLLPSMFFLFMYRDWRWVLRLWGGHMLLWLFTLFCMVTGLTIWDTGLALVDIVTKYLTPALSMGAVIWVWMSRQQNQNRSEYA